MDCKQPFAAPQHVTRYLGRYTHKVAISNHRIIDISGEQISFSAKDYRHENRKITVEMNQQEFIRRFALHTSQRVCTQLRNPMQFKERGNHTGTAADTGKTGNTSSANRNNTSHLSGLQKGHDDGGDGIFRKKTK